VSVFQIFIRAKIANVKVEIFSEKRKLSFAKILTCYERSHVSCKYFFPAGTESLGLRARSKEQGARSKEQGAKSKEQ